MTPKELLLKAAEWLEAHEWVQYSLWETRPGEDEPYAASGVGARIIVAPVGLKSDAYGLVEQYVGVSGVSYWNDEPGRTKEEVISALRGAAALYKATS